MIGAPPPDMIGAPPPPPAPQPTASPPPLAAVGASEGAPPPPGPPDGGPHVSAIRRRPGGLLVGILAAVLVLLLGGGGLAVWLLVGRAPAGPAVVAPIVVGSETPQPQTSRSSSPKPSASLSTSQAPQVASPREFKSQSGNIRCSMDQFYGQPGVVCQQVLIHYDRPSQTCPTGAAGVFVAVGASGTYWPCIATSIEPAEAIAFDTPITRDGITCAINYTTGVTCRNANGNGFSMEYDRGVSLF